MVAHVGRNWAEKWGTAHETGTIGQPEIEKAMDLHNNEIGRNTSADSNIVQTLIRQGDCLRIVENNLTATDASDEIR